jgi:hypothetical protein
MQLPLKLLKLWRTSWPSLSPALPKLSQPLARRALQTVLALLHFPGVTSWGVGRILCRILTLLSEVPFVKPRPSCLATSQFQRCTPVTLSAWELNILLGNGHPDRAQLAPAWRPVTYEGTSAAR